MSARLEPLEFNPTRAKQRSQGRAVTALILLAMVYGISIVDRSIFGLLLQPIKREFALSDTMLGLIGSFGFALTYSVAGLPLARLSDRVDRKRVVLCSLACYSLITMLTGMVASSMQLAAARIGLALGESAALPAGTAIITDYFPTRTRSRAMALLGAGPPIATLLAFALAGKINAVYGWRWAFASVGLIGLALSSAVALLLHEPARGASDGALADKRTLPLGQALRFLRGQRSYLCLVAAGILMACTMACVSQWGPAFLVRVHGFKPAELGATLGLVNGIAGLGGTVLGGVLSDIVGRRSFQWKLLVPAAACGLAAPAMLLFLFGQGQFAALCGLAATTALVAMQYGGLFATLQTVVKVSVRAFSVSLFLVFTTVLGVGLGPVSVGAVADALTASHGPAAIRYALVVPTVTCLLGSLLILLAIRFVAADIESAQRPEATTS